MMMTMIVKMMMKNIKISVVEQKRNMQRGGTGDIPKKDIGVTDIIVPETKQQEQTFIIKSIR